jgi:hypothetical protein
MCDEISSVDTDATESWAVGTVMPSPEDVQLKPDDKG